MSAESQPMTILPVRLLAAGALCVLIAACGAAPADDRLTIKPGSDLPQIDVTMHVPAGHQGEIRRYRDGVRTTLLVLGTWLGPLPALTLDIAPEPTRWWTSEASMAPETAAARAVSRAYFTRVIDTSALPPDL